MDMSNLGFDVFNHFGPVWDSFAATWKSEFFVEEGEGSGTADMALSVIGDTVNSIPPSVTGGVTVASSAVEAVALIDADQSVKGDDVFE